MFVPSVCRWISRFPALAFYRNGEYIKFSGPDLSNERAVLAWLTGEKTLRVPGQILAVNSLMLTKMVSGTAKRRKGPQHPLLVFFYEDDTDVLAERVLRDLEEAEEILAATDIVKVCENGIASDYRLSSLPALAVVRNGNILQFQGDLRQKEKVMSWLDNMIKA